MNKTFNQKAWFFVIPVFVLVAFNAAVPLMTVVNYSFQETFGSNVFAWEGTRWFKEILHSERFHASLGRQVIFTFIILLFSTRLEVISPDGNKSSLSASLTVFLIKFPLSFIFDTKSYLPIATIFSTDNLALLIVSWSMIISPVSFSRQSKIFGKVILFMCGQRLHGLINSTFGFST